MRKKLYILTFIVVGSLVYWEIHHLSKIRYFESYMFPAENFSLSDEPLQRFPFLLDEARKCVNRTPFLVLLIPSKPEDAATRDAIRMTWGNASLVPGVDIMRLFLIGVPSLYSFSVRNGILGESATFGDIIQQHFLDTYNNLTIKTMMGMEWVSNYCPNASYIMKIDSDMFMNPDLLVHRLLQPNLEARKNYFTGMVVQKGWPDRKNTRKWYASKEVYSGDMYPSYCSGTGYVLSGDLAAKIFKVAYLLKLLFMEDVFMGLCLAKLRIRIIDPPNYLFIGVRVEYNRCQFAKLITVHHYTKEELVRLWPDFMKAKNTC